MATTTFAHHFGVVLDNLDVIQCALPRVSFLHSFHIRLVLAYSCAAPVIGFGSHFMRYVGYLALVENVGFFDRGDLKDKVETEGVCCRSNKSI